LGFIVPSLDLTARQRAGADSDAVEVRFRGPIEGRLVLRTGGAILPAIVANMLGEDAGAVPNAERDALGEMANVICGNVLPEFAGNDATFNLDAPRWIAAPNAPAAEAPAAHARVLVGVGPGRAEVQLYINGAAAGQPEGRAA